MARFDQIVALLLAGGHGCRIHSDRPKQFMEVAGIPVIAYTMRTLQEHPDVDAVYVVCTAEWEDFVARFQKTEPGSSSAEKWQLMEQIFKLPE